MNSKEFKGKSSDLAISQKQITGAPISPFEQKAPRDWRQVLSERKCHKDSFVVALKLRLNRKKDTSLKDWLLLQVGGNKSDLPEYLKLLLVEVMYRYKDLSFEQLKVLWGDHK